MSTSIGAEFIKELIAGADPEKLAAFIKEIQPQKAKAIKVIRESNGPVKEYSKVIKNYTCLACDQKFSVMYKMEKGEQVTTISQDGITKMYNIREGEDLELSCFCTICANCPENMKKWDREELRRRWITLIKSCSFQEKRNYQKSFCGKL